jgi:hypothetical protein
VSAPAKIINSRGVRLELRLLQILERDPLGRPTLTRVVYDEQKLGELATHGARHLDFILCYIATDDLGPKIGGLA